MERHASEFIGKPIITFDTGQRLAQVEDLLVDPERNQVLALLVDKGAVWVSPKVVPFGHIKAIGENAIVVPQRGVIYDSRRDKELQRVFDKRTIRGMRVYSETGDRLGVVGDMIIDDHTGEVLYYEVSGGAIGDAMKGKRTIVPSEVLNMGRLVLYVSQATATRLESQQGGVTAAFGQARERITALSDQHADAVDQARQRITALSDQHANAVDQARQRITALSDQHADALEQARQRVAMLSDQSADRAGTQITRLTAQLRQQQQSYVVGRTALRTVVGTDGQPIVQEGEVITEETVARAEQEGRLPALLLAGGSGAARQQFGTLGEQAGESWEQIRQEARHLWDQLMHHTDRISGETETRLTQERIDRALGRPAARVILDRQDNVILNTGDIITNTAVELARQAGVLHILLDSAYTERPQLSLADLKAPWSGRASLEEAQGRPVLSPGGSPSPATTADGALSPAVGEPPPVTR